MKVTLTFQGGEIKSFPIKNKSFLIGRSNKCEVHVQSSEFSREHCRVDIVGQAIYLTDLSSNGVFIDNLQLSPQKRTLYKTNQQLQIGECYVVFDLSSAELTRSMVNMRPLLQSENQTGITKLKVKKHEEAAKKRESKQSTFLVLVAWVFLLAGTFYLANTAFSV